MTRRACLAAAVLLTASAPLVAQNTQQPVFRAGVELIEVDVSVVDDRGRPIADMRAPEFTVTVDGKPRRIVSSQFISLRPAPTADGRQQPAERTAVNFSSNASRPAGRLILIAVDRENIAFGGGREVVPAAKRFLDTLGPNDKVAFVTVPLGRQVGFTSNHKLIHAELDRIVGFAHRPKVDLNIGVTEAFAIDEHTDPRMEVEVIARFCARYRAGSPEAEACELNVRTQAATIVHESHIRSDAAIQTLEAILETLKDIDGPKSLVWISQGLVTSRGAGELAGIERIADAARTTVNILMLDEPIVDVSQSEKSPTARDDRNLEMEGLEILAGRTRGALYRVSVNANAAFRQMEEELSGYYLLGVEANPADRDGKRHPIKVSILRKGVTLRARREFEFAKADAASKLSAEERIQRALRSPFNATEIPVRIATYAYQDTKSPKIRVFIATEIDGRESPSPDMTMGYSLVDREGKLASSAIQKRKFESTQGPEGAVFEDTGSILLDPGSYTLKLAIVDANGRRGSIEHPVEAYQMTGVPFAVGDLMLADNPVSGTDAIRPPVEARISNGRLATYLELYTNDAAAFGPMRVAFEVAASETSPALVSGPGTLTDMGASTKRAGAIVPVAALPPGQYVARAIIRRGDEKIGELSRPFHVTRASAAAGVAAPGGSAGTVASAGAGLIGSMLPPPDAFRAEDVLKGETLNTFLDVLDKGRPALKPATAQVRRGTFAGAARAAFDADDQVAAMFLRGLELLAGGQLTQAATQFTGALRGAPDFAPASFYLGACYAAGGRDQDAAAAWKKALTPETKSAAGYAVLADAFLRLRDGAQATSVLTQAAAAYPDNDAIRRRLAFAQALALEHAAALSTIEPYLARHPDDQDALLVALHAIYAAQVGGKPLLSGPETAERMGKYSRAYTAAKGRHVDLVRTWVEYVKQ